MKLGSSLSQHFNSQRAHIKENFENNNRQNGINSIQEPASYKQCPLCTKSPAKQNQDLEPHWMKNVKNWNQTLKSTKIKIQNIHLYEVGKEFKV